MHDDEQSASPAETDTEPQSPLWEVVPLDRFERPSEPTGETVRKGLKGVWRSLLGAPDTEPESMDGAQVPHPTVGQAVVDRAAPPPDWSGPATALELALADWPEADGQTMSACLIVGPPHGGIGETLRHWAWMRGWRVLEAPDPEAILTGAEDWQEQLADRDAGPAVLPSLEHCYLRHPLGLGLIRRMVAQLAAPTIPILVGCDSWAFAFLGRALALQSGVPAPWTLQALDHERTERWLAEMADPALRFHQVEGGDLVLPPPLAAVTAATRGHGEGDGEGHDNGGHESEPVSGFCRFLAAYARGNPGVIRAIWRHCLEMAATEEVEQALLDRLGTPAHGIHRVWLDSWQKMRLPTLIADPPDLDQYFLHTLLVHGGLPEDILPTVLPAPGTDLGRSLRRLSADNIIGEYNGRWQVTGAGYPSVRQVMARQGLLLDAF
ncbi:MAG: hypothetical protein EA405_09050 [Rhodospirillales bacterium]|nr:MAG: hypothetical protein EA405_09050 [Rhodospirillales bacterium]